jgi:CRP-like cAMP-binding protein
VICPVFVASDLTGFRIAPKRGAMMDRIRVLQEIRMQRFEEIHERFMKRRLSETEAAEWLGVSERTFRRQRRRYEDEGLVGLLDRRLGKISPHRVPADEVEAV